MKFAGFSVRFRRLRSLFEESRYVEEMMFVRSKLLGLNKNKNLQCLSFLKTYTCKRLLTQGQFKNVMLETLILNKSCCGGEKVKQYDLLSAILDFDIFKQPPIVSYKKEKSLKDILVRAKLPLIMPQS